MTSSSTKPTHHVEGKPATSMAELMAKMGSKVSPLKKGEKVTGKLTEVSAHEVMLRADSGVDMVVLEKDRRLHKQLSNLLKSGDTVTAIVLYPESDAGYPAVTLREFMAEKVWQELEKLQKSGQEVLVTVTETTKGGLVVESDSGVAGFLPNSHMNKKQQTENLIGQKLSVHVAELHRDTKKVVFSQKNALTADDFAKLAKEYNAGTKVTGTVNGITQFGIFVGLPFTTTKNENITVDGLVHISEVSWEKVADLHELFQTGQTVEAVVIGVDGRSKRIDLSLKKLIQDPFQAILDSFPAEKKVNGTAKEMTQDGLIVDLGEVDGISVEGLIKKDKIPPTIKYEVGSLITATVVSIDSRKRKVMLTPILLEKPLMYR